MTKDTKLATIAKPEYHLRLESNLAYRYKSGKYTGEKVEFDITVDMKQLRTELEYFRQFGLEYVGEHE